MTTSKLFILAFITLSAIQALDTVIVQEEFNWESEFCFEEEYQAEEECILENEIVIETETDNLSGAISSGLASAPIILYCGSQACPANGEPVCIKDCTDGNCPRMASDSCTACSDPTVLTYTYAQC